MSSAATPSANKAASIPRDRELSKQSPIAEFARELGKALSRGYAESSALEQIFGSVFIDPLTAAHDTACKVGGVASSPHTWLRVLAGAAPDVPEERLAAAAAENVGRLVSNHLRMSATSPPKATLPTFKQIQVPPGFPTSQKPDFRRVEHVVRAIQSFGAIGAREMLTLPARLVGAQAVETAARLIPGVRSTPELGQNVHKRLQDAYLRSTPGFETVMDRRVYGPGFSVYPTPGPTLLEAATRYGRPVFAAMQLAWVTKAFDSRLRADVTSLSLRENWEIKPVGSVVLGVLQESWYRCSFNWVARTLRQENPAFEVDLQELEPGGRWPPQAMSAIVLESSGSARLIIPFTIVTLPGLILYAGIAGPGAEAAALLLYLLRDIDRELRKRGKRVLDGLAYARDALAETLGWVFAFIVVALVLVVLVIVAVVVFRALAAAAAALAGAGTAVGEALLVLRLVSALSGLTLIVPDTEASKEPATDPHSGLDFGPIAIALRTSAIPQFVDMYERIMTACYAKFAGILQQGGPAAAPDTTRS